MLHKDKFIIDPLTFTLIQELQQINELRSFNLVGGTALALQLGHRNSIDIDLFTQEEFNAEIIFNCTSHLGFSSTLFKNNTVLSTINNIKTDFIRHNYPILKPIIEEEGIRMLSLEDIAAMKIHVIAQSGKRLKDFIDLYYLLQLFSLSQILSYFTKKNALT